VLQLQDLVSASVNDNAVSWYRNLGPSLSNESVSLYLDFSIKKEITWESMGIVSLAVGDIDADGDVGTSVCIDKFAHLASGLLMSSCLCIHTTSFCNSFDIQML
jgi:hypothetical protein